MLRKTITSLAGASVLALPVTNAFGAVQATGATHAKKKVVTTTATVTGSAVEADRWGPLQVSLVVAKTTTTTGRKKTVTFKITRVTAPLYPDHSDRSLFINEQALPLLEQEVLTLQSANIQMVSGATDTSYAFAQSLQAALLKLRS